MSYLATGNQPFGPRGADYKPPEQKTYDTPPADTNLLQKSLATVKETVDKIAGKPGSTQRTTVILGGAAAALWLLTRKK